MNSMITFDVALCGLGKRGRTFQVCVGFLELSPSFSRLVVYPVVDGSDCPAVVFWIDEIRDAADILAEKS